MVEAAKGGIRSREAAQKSGVTQTIKSDVALKLVMCF